MTPGEIIQIVETVIKLIEAVKGLGIDFTGIKLQTSAPIDLLALFQGAKKP